MYIIAIGWLWVALMMALTETSLIAGVLTLLFYGIAPCGLLLWLLNTPNRRRRRSVPDKLLHQPDRADPQQDQ